jgi:outer membrane protein assembly factor BamD
VTPSPNRFLLPLLLLVLLFGLPGCTTIKGWFGAEYDERNETLEADALYEQSRRSLQRGAYDRAAVSYQRLIARFPYGPVSEQAQLELAYAHYKLDRRDEAISGIDRFIRTYPTHRHLAYAYYLRGLVNFDRNDTALMRLARLDPAQRDQASARQSFEDFGVVATRFPNSRYAGDARQRMIYLRNLVARAEMNTGMYYFRRGAYVSALGRARYLIQNYPESEYQADALALMAASYDRLGQKELADDSRRVLQANSPDHPLLRGEEWPDPDSIWWRLNPFTGN